MSDSHTSISHLLADWGAGDVDALDALLPRVHGRLYRQARLLLRHERRNQTLQPTSLVNEAFLRLLRQRTVRWKNRRHFFAIAAMAMRRVLLDSVRRRRTQRRGGDPLRISLTGLEPQVLPDLDAVALQQALEELRKLDPRQETIVRLRYFEGLSVPAVAVALAVSVSTVEADWRMARAWLHRRLTDRSRRSGR